MKITAALFAAFAMVFCAASCDKHSWESTQVLHEGMHKAHDKDHGDAHGGSHGKDVHAEKPAKH